MWIWVLLGFVWVLMLIGVAAAGSLSGRMQQRLEGNERRRAINRGRKVVDLTEYKEIR